MGRWQPYLYNAPQRDSFMDAPSTFNPKAVTMASREPPSPKKKAQGPLVNFNQHPDSYPILPYGKTDAKPMNPKTKVFIKTARWIQLFFRVLTLLGAIGALLCSIFIKGAQDTEAYVMKIPPSADIVVTLYAIYHLLRTAKARPAASSASYHFFALITDSGFVPFYTFIALLGKRNSDMEAGTSGRWRTFFPTDEETDKVLTSVWLTATTVAGFHCIALVLDLYLVLVFRNIARLPPDMNPLEDNLTSRRKRKHKHKNSSISAILPRTVDEKRFSGQSAATTIVGSTNSQTDPLMAGKIPSPDETKMAFIHTRTNSDMVYSPHTPKSARQSRQSLYSRPASMIQSRGDLNTRDDLHRRGDTDDDETLAQRKSFLAEKAIKRSSRPKSFVSSKKDFHLPALNANSHEATGDLSLGHSENWFVHQKSPAKQLFQSKNQSQGYNSVSMSDDMYSDNELEPPLLPQPLRMNPPSPPLQPKKSVHNDQSTRPARSHKRSQTTTSISTTSMYSQPSHSPAGTPKTRHYGDLMAASQAIKNGPNWSSTPPNGVPTRGSGTSNHIRAESQDTADSSSPANNYLANSPTRKYLPNSPIRLSEKSYASVRRTGEAGYTPIRNQSPRVVSRTGVDYQGGNDFDYDDVSDLGTGRRDVSGKIAEEGRGGVANLAERWGGAKGYGLTFRKVSGVA